MASGTACVQGTGSAGARLDRLPFTRTHRNFLLMVASGEFVETTVLVGNGALLAVLAAPITAGAAYLVSQPQPGPYSWRVLFWGIGVLPLIVWFIRLRIPESPRWLEVHGRHDEADAALDRLEEQARQQYGADVPAGQGVGIVHTLLFTMIIDAGFFVGSIVNIFFIDHVERKWGIIVGAVRSMAAGTVYSVSRISTSILVAVIATWFLPLGMLATYGLIWFFILVVVVIGVWGPRASRLHLEAISE